MKIHEVFSYLCVDGAARAVEFYKLAFGATESFRLVEPSGRIGHVELAFGDTIVMLCDEYPELGWRAPAAGAAVSCAIHLHVDDADATIRQAVEAGATLVRAPEDHFYGERSGTVRDPFGHQWLIGHHIEDVTPAEMQRRYDEMMRGS